MSIISLNSKQYVINEGEKIAVLKLGKNAGDIFETKDILTGQALKLKVVENKKSSKTKVLKFIKKKGYKRTLGSRDHLSIIEYVSTGGNKEIDKKTSKVKKNTAK
jgi:ribosomal protein L21